MCSAALYMGRKVVVESELESRRGTAPAGLDFWMTNPKL